jgi:hypothetical protein
MKTRPDALSTAENEFGSAKHENVTRRPRYRGKRLWERKTCKWDLAPSVPPKTSPGAQNMKMGPDALGTARNEYRAQNMKTGTYALGTAENESGSAKYENRT